MVPLTDRTLKIINQLFAAPDRAAVADLLANDCADNLPFMSGDAPVRFERLRFAALKLSGGNVDKLVDAVVTAQSDWRDLLVWAGFGDSIRQHEAWADGVLAAG